MRLHPIVGIRHGGLSNEAIEDMANANLYVMRFLGLSLEDDAPDHSVLSRFRTRLTAVQAWDDLLAQINQQVHALNVTVTTGCHIDASITHSPRKPKTKPSYEVVRDREERDDASSAQEVMKVIEVEQPGVNTDAHWVKKSGKSLFSYKQHTLVDDNGLVMAVETTAANQHDSQPMLELLDKAAIKPGTRVHTDKAYCSKKHREALKARGIRNGIQDKAVNWHILQAIAYNLKRLPKLFMQSLALQDT